VFENIFLILMSNFLYHLRKFFILSLSAYKVNDQVQRVLCSEWHNVGWLCWKELLASDWSITAVTVATCACGDNLSHIRKMVILIHLGENLAA
jgi:hypothetical protein